MTGPYRRKKVHKAIRDISRKYRTRNRPKDLDQIHEELHSQKLQKISSEPATENLDLPGMGAFPCLHCARYFIDDENLQKHLITKLHKRRVKILQEEPYTIEESERAGGLTR